MSKILVFGHQNPDSDAIGSSVASLLILQNSYGLDTEAVALGLQMKKQPCIELFCVEAPQRG